MDASRVTFGGKQAIKVTQTVAYQTAFLAADTNHVNQGNAYLEFPFKMFYQGTIDLDLALVRNSYAYSLNIGGGKTFNVGAFGGLLFHKFGSNQYNAVYLRAANGAANSVQYISPPNYIFSNIASQYSATVGTTISESTWVHLKIAVYNGLLSVYVGTSTVPVLNNVPLLGTYKKNGKIGLFVDSGTDAYFANVIVNKYQPIEEQKKKAASGSKQKG